MKESSWTVVTETKKYWNDFIQTDIWLYGENLWKFRVSWYPERVKNQVIFLIEKYWIKKEWI